MPEDMFLNNGVGGLAAKTGIDGCSTGKRVSRAALKA